MSSGIKIASAALAASVASGLQGAVTITKAGGPYCYVGNTWDTSNFPAQYKDMSGITWAGGNKFYVIQNNNYLSVMTPTIDASNGNLTALPNKTVGIPLVGANDPEGIAYDPCSGNVWVACEKNAQGGKGAQILEYDPETGDPTMRAVPVPAVITSNVRDNLSLESLTISGDGLTMWTANEEALSCDGGTATDLAGGSQGTTVRLVKFTRPNVYGAWTCAGMWAYVCEPLASGYPVNGGVSDLVALPDGSLLVMERDVDTSGTKARGYCRLYRPNFEGATDVSNMSSLASGGFTPVSKGSALLAFDDTTAISGQSYDYDVSCYEGICLGPSNGDGSVNLMLVSDGGAYKSKTVDLVLFSITVEVYVQPFVRALKLSGIGNVRTLNFNEPSVGTASITGDTYRFLDGTPLTVSLSGDVFDQRAYTNRSDAVYNVSWELSNQASGTGTVASFTVSNGGTLSWTTTAAGVAGGNIFLNDTFEGYAVGKAGSDVVGWTGDGEVIEATYSAPAAGYVMQKAAHTKVLDVDGEATRSVAPDQAATNANRKVDVMVEIRRSREPLAALAADVQLAVAADTNGEICVWHARNEGGVVGNGWTPLSSATFDDGQWVRVGIEVSYSGNVGYARVRLNGSICTTDYGYRYPDGNVAGGAWHRIACSASTFSEIGFVGTKADDLIVTTEGYASEDSTAAGYTGGVPNAWFDQNSLPRDAAAQTGIPGYTMADVYATGVDPYGTEPFKITSFSFDTVPTLEFNALESDFRSFKILRSSTPDFKSGTVTELGSGDGSFTGNSPNWSTRWEGKGTQPAGAFFKVVVE